MPTSRRCTRYTVLGEPCKNKTNQPGGWCGLCAGHVSPRVGLVNAEIDTDDINMDDYADSSTSTENTTTQDSETRSDNDIPLLSLWQSGDSSDKLKEAISRLGQDSRETLTPSEYGYYWIHGGNYESAQECEEHLNSRLDEIGRDCDRVLSAGLTYMTEDEDMRNALRDALEGSEQEFANITSWAVHEACLLEEQGHERGMLESLRREQGFPLGAEQYWDSDWQTGQNSDEKSLIFQMRAEWHEGHHPETGEIEGRQTWERSYNLGTTSQIRGWLEEVLQQETSRR